jgi:hypothetical protein
LLKVRRLAASFPPPGGNLRAVNAPDETTSVTTPEEGRPGRVKRAAGVVISKPRDAAKAVGGGFKWAGRGVAEKTKVAGHGIGDRTKAVRGAVTAKTSPPWNAAKEKFQANPWMGIAAITGVVLVIAWIAWAIYVTAENGANAGLGVVISWPAVFMAIALVMAPFVGLYFLVRRLQGEDASGPPMAGGAPDGD